MTKKDKGPVGFPCPDNCTGGSVQVPHGLCRSKGCNDCGGKGWTWETCPRCHGRGVVD